MTVNERLALSLDQATVLDHKRQDKAISRITGIIDDWYLDLVRASAHRVTIYRAVQHIQMVYRNRLIDAYMEEMNKLLHQSYDETSDAIIRALPEQAALFLINEHGGLQESWQSLKSKTSKWFKEVVFPRIKEVSALAILVTARVLEWLLRAIRNLTAPVMISVITQAQGSGLTAEEIAKKFLEPRLQVIKSDVERATRTSLSIVTNKAKMEAYQKLGKLLIGFQLRTHPFDGRNRWWHFDRRFNKYYFKPKKGQDGMSKMPDPPYEPIDPAERPTGAPYLAYYCRCGLVPIVRLTGREPIPDIDFPHFPTGGAV